MSYCGPVPGALRGPDSGCRFSHVGRELVSLSVASHLKSRYGCYPVALGFDHQIVSGARQVSVKDGETVAVCPQLQICHLCSLEGSRVCAHAVLARMSQR
jgi:hypothetical protein